MAQVYQNKEKNITILGTETDFTGELTFRDNLVITGKFHGSINATGASEFPTICTLCARSITPLSYNPMPSPNFSKQI